MYFSAIDQYLGGCGCCGTGGIGSDGCGAPGSGVPGPGMPGGENGGGIGWPCWGIGGGVFCGICGGICGCSGSVGAICDGDCIGCGCGCAMFISAAAMPLRPWLTCGEYGIA
jgi:hypothetical protein